MQIPDEAIYKAIEGGWTGHAKLIGEGDTLDWWLKLDKDND